MFLQFVSREYRTNEDVQGFDSRWDWNTAPTATTNPGVATTRTGSFKPLSGIFAQQKYLPIRFMPLTLEIELVNNPADAVISPAGAGQAPAFIAANTSTTWQITNVMAKCDVVTLDNALDNSISKHLLDGNTLTINYSTYLTQEQVVPSATFNVNVIRAVTRLKAIFFTFFGEVPDAQKLYMKEANLFYHPMFYASGGYDATGVYNPALELDLQLQLGSKLTPEYPIRSLAEAFYQLRKCLGVVASPIHGFTITPGDYRQYKFIVGLDQEKLLDSAFTGQNTRSGELLTIRCKGANAANIANPPSKVYIVLLTDNILEISAAGCNVFD